jgi:hypothetical protein
MIGAQSFGAPQRALKDVSIELAPGEMVGSAAVKADRDAELLAHCPRPTHVIQVVVGQQHRQRPRQAQT